MNKKEIKSEQYEFNRLALQEYMDKKHYSRAKMAKITEINETTLDHVLTGTSMGTFYLWEKISKLTGVDMFYRDHIPLGFIDDPTIRFVLRHLEKFDSTCISDTDSKRLGGIDRVVEILNNNGLDCEWRLGYSGLIIQKRKAGDEDRAFIRETKAMMDIICEREYDIDTYKKIRKFIKEEKLL